MDSMEQQTSQRALLWIVAAGFFMQALDTTIVNTALPAMAHSLGERPLAMQPVVVAYSLTMAMLTPSSGWLADRFGTRRVYFAAILIFAIGSAFCASAPTLGALVIARIVQGAGGSMLLPIGRLAVLRSFSGEAYLSALAFVSISGQIGPLIGPTLGGWLVQVTSWHWIFLINLPIGLVGLFAVRRFLPVERAMEAPPPFDIAGFALLSVCMVAFSLALDAPAGSGHRIGWALGLLALSLVAAYAYLPHARRRAQPLFPLSLFESESFRLGLIGNLVARVGSSAVPFLLPLLLQLQLGYSPLHSGLMMLPVAIAGALSKRGVMPLVRRFGYAGFLVANTLLVGASIIGFAALAPGWPLPVALLQLAVFGAANSLQFAAMNSVTLKDLDRRQASSGNSLFSMAQMLAMGLGVTVGGGLVDLFTGHVGAVVAFRLAFVSVGVITLLSAAVFHRIGTVTRAHSAG
ncbi:drug resistance transporter, EmrB/QacA subfamily [Chitinasiproducens palmae]|uniref:Drug resistance transporter, EmrB/QacA subfamily n=2 Tax=Chitinasiproducens palmae TaxID=1770053 RepID=A0A1H2PV29_9BURK|nr:drug resistance transporter, EmrB/QacA subfamily [Chitinasiproducens palmae]